MLIEHYIIFSLGLVVLGLILSQRMLFVEYKRMCEDHEYLKKEQNRLEEENEQSHKGYKHYCAESKHYRMECIKKGKEIRQYKDAFYKIKKIMEEFE